MRNLKPTSRNLSLFITSFLMILCFQGSAQNAIWKNRFNGAGDNSDRYNALITDGSGNFYLTGYTVRSGSGKDFLTVKMNSLGDTLWTKTFNNVLENKDDESYFIALDASGNIIVTGSSDGGSTSTKTDFLTLKYNTSGTLLWSARYNYLTVNEDEFPTGLMIDASDNIFVTGRSDHDALNVDDYLTIKYNSSGTEQWTSRFDGGFTDRPVGIVTDGLSGCVITGRSGNGVNDDIVTINYSSTGTVNWSKTFAGAGGDDRGEAIVRDASGNIYVSGTRANASDDDFLTICYSSLGVLQWSAAFDGGDNDRVIANTIDAGNNIYVTGQSDVDLGGSTNYDFKTIKYNSSGIQQWAVTTGNAVNQEDTPTNIFVDASNNIYVIGKSDAASGSTLNYQEMTVKYNSSGIQQWVANYNGTTSNGEDIPSAVTVDISSNVWVSGSANNTSTQKDAVLLKYNSTGVFQAAKSYNGKGDFNDKVQAIAVDVSNNIYTTGYTIAAEQQKNILVQKMNSSGVTQWTKTFDGTTENDEGNAIAVNSIGEVFIAGYSNGAGSYDDVKLLKYNTSGIIQWQATYNSGFNQLDKAVSILLSTAGDIYVTGYSDGDISAAFNYDYLTLKFNSLGLLQWAVRYNGTGNANDKATKIVAIGNSLYVTGTSSNGTNDDIVTVKYDMATGTQQSVAIHNGTGSGNDSGEDIFALGNNLYIAGSSFKTTGSDDFVVIKYDTLLTPLWTSTYNGTGNSIDIAHAVIANSTDVYVTGTSIGSSSSDDIAIIKYDAISGTQTWAKRYTSSGAFEDEAYSIALDNTTNNIYAGGESGNAANISDFVVVNYNAAGTKIITPKYNGTGNGEDIGRRIILDNLGYLYITGYSTGTGSSNFDFTTVKYCTPVPSVSITAGGPTSFCVGGSVVLSASTSDGVTYQWKKGATNISGATGSTYTATTAGSYFCIVTNLNGCTKTSNKIVVTVPCREGEMISEINPLDFMIQPNPFSINAILHFENPLHQNAQLEIIDITGRLIQVYELTKGISEFEFGNEITPGFYEAIISINGNNTIYKFIKSE